MKKIISILAIMLVLSMITTNILGAQNINEMQRQNNEIAAINQYNQLTQCLDAEKKLKTKSISSDYYGGSYINDNGELVVCVTEDYSLDSNVIQTYTANDDINIQRVEYTYDELVQGYNEIVTLHKELIELLNENSSENIEPKQKDMILSICGIYLTVKNNCVVVELDEISTEKIQFFKTFISDKSYIEFEEGEPLTYNTESRDIDDPSTGAIFWKPGSGLNAGSTGFTVYYNEGTTRKVGFITSAHGYKNIGIPVWGKGYTPEIGEVYDRKFGGRYDVTLIELKDEYTMNRISEYGVVLKQKFATLIEGLVVYKEGCATGKTPGRVLSTMYATYMNFEGEQIYHYDILKTSAASCNGDSGGVMYDSSGNIVGTIMGSKHTSSNETVDTCEYSIVCKAQYAVDAFSLWECSLTSAYSN